jgi:hypothetical protein
VKFSTTFGPGKAGGVGGRVVGELLVSLEAVAVAVDQHDRAGERGGLQEQLAWLRYRPWEHTKITTSARHTTLHSGHNAAGVSLDHGKWARSRALAHIPFAP